MRVSSILSLDRNGPTWIKPPPLVQSEPNAIGLGRVGGTGICLGAVDSSQLQSPEDLQLTEAACHLL